MFLKKKTIYIHEIYVHLNRVRMRMMISLHRELNPTYVRVGCCWFSIYSLNFPIIIFFSISFINERINIFLVYHWLYMYTWMCVWESIKYWYDLVIIYPLMDVIGIYRILRLGRMGLKMKHLLTDLNVEIKYWGRFSVFRCTLFLKTTKKLIELQPN